MLAKLAVLLRRVPHALFVLAALVVAATPQIVLSITGTPLGPYAQDLTQFAAFCATVLALAKQFGPADPRAEVVDQAIARAAKAVPPLPVLLLGALGVLIALVIGCSAAQAKTDLTTALNLEQDACSVADTTGDSYVVFGCALATLGLQSAIALDSLFLKVPVAIAASFAAQHPETEASKPMVFAWKALHPAAAVELGKLGLAQ